MQKNSSKKTKQGYNGARHRGETPGRFYIITHRNMQKKTTRQAVQHNRFASRRYNKGKIKPERPHYTRPERMRLARTEEATVAVKYNHRITAGERPGRGVKECQNYAETRIACNMERQPGRETRYGRYMMLINDRRKHKEETIHNLLKK